ncbi:hypothetical protein QQF64_011299 [Cirrhinus molitorella]|uniref:Ig-like domain-containing protein n=1 Tax=Cirrhinus molitorella TaxID=172907 RepID=A0ABR3M0F7_9TELE
MVRNPVLLLCLLCGHFGHLFSSVVQTPSEVIVHSGQARTLFCSHSISSYNTILWYYQHRHGQGMHIIGYSFHGTHNLENVDDKKYKLEGDAKTSVNLTISDLTLTPNMIRFVFSIIFFLSWFTGYLICEKVHQSPSDVLCKPNDSVNLTCRHKITSYDTILWYQRSYGDSSLKLIGYARYSSTKEFEPSYKDHFKLTGNGEEEVTLEILQARPDQDSAEYFCAAFYAQCNKCSPSMTKTLL